MELPANTTLSHYRIVTKIGAGGMGEVYLAEDTRLKRKVALKLLPVQLTSDPDRVRRFEQEAQSASALNNPNIITIHEIGNADGLHFIATEYIEGQTLRESLSSGKLKLIKALDVATQIASALSAAHVAGIIHRDIKPENVILRPDGLVKVVDFGLAKLSEQQPGQVDIEAQTLAGAITDPGIIMGTVGYMSPEQARGLKLDARSDIFSLGIVLYEMIAGRAPFGGATTTDVLVSILEREPQPLSSVTAGVPAELERIVGKALEKDREERYQVSKDLHLDLKKLKQRLEFEAEMERSIPPTEARRIGTADSERTLTDQNPLLRTAGANPAVTTSSAEYLASQIKRHKAGSILGAILIVLAVGAGGYFAYTNRSASGPVESLAVLPFQNRGSDADSEYLADGLVESLIYRLSQVPNLKVSPTSSVFRYKGTEKDPLTAGKELGVSAVMSGRIVQRGENLSISVELVDVRNTKTLWGEKYERRLSELLATQREMASEISQRLQLKLSGEGDNALTKRYTENNEAYQLYLKGRFHFARRSKDSLGRAVECFEQAIRLDPRFALAYVGLAEAAGIKPSTAFIAPREALPKAMAAAQQALRIDPNLAEAHAALGQALTGDWQWAEAERAFKRAIELNPNVANTHYYYGLLLQRLGQTEQAIAEIKRAIELEPLSLIINANLAGAYIFNRQYKLALEQAKRTYELDHSFLGGQIWLGYAYLVNDMFAETIEICESSIRLDPTNQWFISLAGYAYAKSGRRNDAEAMITKFNELGRTQYITHQRLSVIHAALGEKDLAFSELEKAFVARDMESRHKVDPLLDPLRDDPRFKDLMRRMELPE